MNGGDRMKVYHGSLVAVEKPEIRVGDRYLDFGYGFYTTMNEEQAIRWTAKQKSRKLFRRNDEETTLSLCHSP